jgi:SAM-dependent methyltransferase
VWLRTLSQQLGNPSGLLGGLVARKLNQNNRGPIEAAVGLLDEVAGREGATVADIGFGGGVGLSLLLERHAGLHVHGVEPSASMITRAQRELRQELSSGRLTLHRATMDALPFADGELDGWISLNPVYFIEDLGPSMVEMARVLATDGTGVVGAADPDWMAGQPFAQQGFVVRPVDELVAQIEGAGLVVERRTAPYGGSEQPYNLLVCRHR